MDQSRDSRDPACICLTGALPLCPATHRASPTSEWGRRIRLGQENAVHAEHVRLGFLSGNCAACYRRRHQAHPVYGFIDGDFDALAEVRPDVPDRGAPID